MSNFTLDELSLALTGTEESGVSFAGKSLKLNDKDDAKDVTNAIRECKKLTYLNLSGNTLGVDAAEGISEALALHPEFEKAQWADAFTGRMLTEIPKALEHLSRGMILAGARLSVLDLSDNALGPNGMVGLAELLKSSTCFGLQELRLNNNGLGIGGARMLARGLLDCHAESKVHGKPLALRVFIAGRNRLENDGAKVLAEVFKTIGTLEVIAMPQNGIYHDGITALAEAFTINMGLRILNLNDNTIGPKGAAALARALPRLQQLQEIDFGDCLLKTEGAVILANALKSGHNKLEGLTLGFNEIGPAGGLALAEAMSNKESLRLLVLGGNRIGESCRQTMVRSLEENGRGDTLRILSEDESDGEEDEEEEESDEESEDSEDKYAETPVIAITPLIPVAPLKPSPIFASPKFQLPIRPEVMLPTTLPISTYGDVNVKQFLKNPSLDNFIGLGNDRANVIITEVKSTPFESYLDVALPTLMKVSALCGSSQDLYRAGALTLTAQLYQELFQWSNKNEQNAILNNALLVNLGLIKSEDKMFHPSWNVDECLLSLNKLIHESYFPENTRQIVGLFLSRSEPNIGSASEKLLSTLSNL